MMKTRTWNLLDYCRGGVLTIKIGNGYVTIIGKDWDFSQGTERKSDQSEAKIWYVHSFSCGNSGWRTAVGVALRDMVHENYRQPIWDWINENI